MIPIYTRADLQSLIENQVSESITLDYKHTDALANTDGKKRELAKDVSAFANSAGGQLVYGIVEVDQRPLSIDTGVDRSRITPEWIEQVLNTNISPRVEGLRITQINLDEAKVAYVLTVPQATSRAPHQAPDHRYYKRYNFMSVAMEDHEVRDVFRRASSPEPFVIFKLDQDLIPVIFSPGAEQSDPIRIRSIIGNRSNAPAEWCVVSTAISRKLNLGIHSFDTMLNGFHGSEELCFGGNKLGPPGHFPIFRETRFQLSEFYVCVPNHLMNSKLEFTLGYHVATPGYSGGERFGLSLANGEMSIMSDAPTPFSFTDE